ncbi:MAG: hypothetical protein ABWZ79_05945 [Pedobacter agri]
MSLANISSMISAKATLQSNINSRAAIGTIQTNLTSVLSLKSTIISNWTSNPVLATDALNLVSTVEKMNWITQVAYCRLYDDELYGILQSGYNLVMSDLAAGGLSQATVDGLYARRDSFRVMMLSTLPTNLLNLIQFIIRGTS